MLLDVIMNKLIIGFESQNEQYLFDSMVSELNIESYNNPHIVFRVNIDLAQLEMTKVIEVMKD